MAARTRINTKFIIILLASFLTVAGSVVVVLAYQMRTDAARQIRLGDELMEQGDAEAASRHYGRAVARDPGNIEYLRAFEKAVREIRPVTGDAARTHYGRLQTAIRQEATYNPSSPAAHLRYIEELHTAARITSQVAPVASRRPVWEQLLNAAEDMLNLVPNTDPMYVHGHLYRGMATIRLRATVSEIDLDRADQDLLTFVEAHPDDDLGWATLAQSRQLMAEHWRSANNQRRAAEAAQRVEPTMQQALEAVPNGPRTNLVFAEYLTSEFRSRTAGVTEQQVLEASRRAIELVRQSENKWLILEASQVAAMLASQEDGSAAIDLFADYAENDPTAIIHQYLLAQIYYQLGENSAAAALAEQVIGAEPLKVSFTSQMQLNLRRLAASLMVDIEHRQYVQAESEGQARTVDSVRAARQRLANYVVDVENDSLLIRADAKLAMLDGDFEEAAGGFERLVRDGTSDVEVMVLSAFCLEQIGQIGLAHERTSAALNLRAAPFLLFRKARLEYQMGRFDDAAQTIAAYMQAATDDPQGAALARAIDASRSGENVAIDDPVELALRDAQQALDDGQTETARATVAAAMAQVDGEDLRLLNAASRIAMRAGQTEAARSYVDRALTVQPDSRHFRQLLAMLETGDPVTAAELFMQSEYDDEAERAVMLLVAYAAIAAEHQTLAAAQTAAGQSELAESSADVAMRAESAASNQLPIAERLAPDHPQLIEYRFARAVASSNWAEAETLANRARDIDADRCRGLMYRGRLEFHRGRYDQAVRAFQQATEIIPYSSMPWRSLAMSFQRLGNMREAQRAFDQAYRANPNDLFTVRNYLALLVQMGEVTRATRIAHTAHRLVPGDERLREGWLELEAQQGNLAVVLPIRRETYVENPEDRSNAVRLAVLLARSEPTVETLVDAEGNRVYTDRRWSQLSQIERQQLLAARKVQWQQEADEIISDLEARHGRDMALASVRALLLRMRGDTNGGEQVLRRYIESKDPSELDVLSLLTLGQYLAETGQFNEAFAEFTRAVDYQSDDKREADRALGSFLFDRGIFNGAIHHFERVLEVEPDYNIALRIVDAYVNQGRYDLADQRLRRVLAEYPVDFVGSMLQAMVAHGLGVQLATAGRDTDAQAKFAEYRQAVDTAERLMPTSPAPHALRARMLLADYRRTGERSLLNDAMTALGAADSVRPNDPQVSLVRIELHQAMGNTNAAATEAARLVDSSPENLQYRHLLIQIHTEARNFPAAVSVINQAIERSPTMVMWHEMLGNTQAEAGNMTAATDAFRRAFELGQSTANLVRYVGTLMSLQNPDYEGVLNMLGTVPDQVDSQPVLGASFAVALHRTGRLDPAGQYIDRSYARQRQLIRDGENPPTEIGRWFQILTPVFASMHPREVEQLVSGLASEGPDPYELLWMARYWSAIGDEGVSRATELLSQAIDRTGEGDEQLRVQLQFEMATYHLVTERYEEAVTGYQRVLRQNPDHAPSLNNLAFVMAQHLNDAEGALPHVQRALELSPQDAPILDTMGWVRFKLGQLTQAEDFLRRSLAISETASTQLHMANVFAAMGEFDNALTRLRRASELRPDSKTQAEIDRLADDIRTKRTQSR